MKKFTPFLACLVMMFFGVSSAQAQAKVQTQYKVSVENGYVFVDGKKLSSEEIPESLKQLPKTARFQFWGSNNAVMEIDGVSYMVTNGKLVEAPEDMLDDGNLTVFFATEESVPFKLMSRAPASSNVVVSGAPQNMYKGYVTAINEQAKELENLQHQIELIAIPEQASLARQLSNEAESAVRLARSFPKVQFETYLDDIQDNDRVLYEELVREHYMEQETHQLAVQIRNATSRTEQEQLTEELRKKLDAIFQLKQENRRVEVDQLNARLSELKEKLKERESLRDEIVENRLRELLNQYRW